MARILLAEDDGGLRRVLAGRLQRAGHEVDAVGDGRTALAAISGQPYDILVTDVVMPGLDGVELARRAVRSRPGLPVVLIAGFAAVAMSQSATTPGHFRPLARPVHLRQLASEVDRILAA